MAVDGGEACAACCGLGYAGVGVWSIRPWVVWANSAAMCFLGVSIRLGWVDLAGTDAVSVLDQGYV